MSAKRREDRDLNNHLPYWAGYVDYFAKLTQDAFCKVMDCLDSDPDRLQSVLDQFEVPSFIKDSHDVLMMANQAYHDDFGSVSNLVGRKAAGFLPPTIVPCSHHSDQMILNGCSKVDFVHQGHDPTGRESIFRTVKLSLPVAEGPYVILGFSQLLEIKGAKTARTKSPAQYWLQFQQLDLREQQIALQICQGQSILEIAQQLDVSRKTVEKGRTIILERMDLPNTHQLAMQLIRIQDQGLADLGF